MPGGRLVEVEEQVDVLSALVGAGGRSLDALDGILQRVGRRGGGESCPAGVAVAVDGAHLEVVLRFGLQALEGERRGLDGAVDFVVVGCFLHVPCRGERVGCAAGVGHGGSLRGGQCAGRAEQAVGRCILVAFQFEFDGRCRDVGGGQADDELRVFLHADFGELNSLPGVAKRLSSGAAS